MNTLKNHLKVCDPSIYDAVLAEEAANRKRREEKKVLDALRMSDKKRKKWKRGSLLTVPDSAKYDFHSNHQKLIDKTVAVFVGATNAPYSVINNEHFRRMLQSLDARYRIPGRTRLQSLIDDVLRTMKVEIQSAMTNARKINFCADIWSKKGLTSSYLGLTAHFYCPDTSSIQHATLAVRELPHPHTGS